MAQGKVTLKFDVLPEEKECLESLCNLLHITKIEFLRRAIAQVEKRTKTKLKKEVKKMKNLDRSNLYDDLHAGSRRFYIFKNEDGEKVYTTEETGNNASFEIDLSENLLEHEWWGTLEDNEAYDVAVDEIIDGANGL